MDNPPDVQSRQEKYAASPKGKAAQARANARYRASKAYHEAQAAKALERSKENPEMFEARREARKIKRQKIREEAEFLAMFPGGNMSPEFKKYREDHGLPWPVPVDEYAEQQKRERAEMRAQGMPVPYILEDII